jgi:hypothetical protein
MDSRTGRWLRGFACVEQSIGTILRTHLGERIMRLDFGSELVRRIGRNMVAIEVLTLYRDVVTAVHRHEPEYRIAQLQLLRIERTGALALGTKGIYFPEGRFDNFDIRESADGAFPLVAAAPAIGGVA